jgi:hypothetical protein
VDGIGKWGDREISTKTSTLKPPNPDADLK